MGYVCREDGGQYRCRETGLAPAVCDASVSQVQGVPFIRFDGQLSSYEEAVRACEAEIAAGAERFVTYDEESGSYTCGQFTGHLDSVPKKYFIPVQAGERGMVCKRP